MSSYIEVKNVSKSFSGRAILQNISLPVEQGTTVGLVGANGSGKSVLFKIICGFEKPDQGSVYVRGNQLGKNGCDFPESLGVFINSPGFIGIYNGFQNLKFLADIQGKIGEKEIRQAMSKVGLDPDNKTKVDNYSLGMKQKLGLAQAIMEGQDTITKRGNAQVMAGQSMRYDLTVANTSNVPLESFFWHDKIPYDVARPTTLTTGTYSARLNYRILYKTNYNASYQVLASNLLTGNNYSFSLNAIPMQAGEVVTDIYFDFGKVPVGFQSVVNPTLSVMVNGNAVNGYQMVNRADVGGKYQGTWQTAAASWVTIIRRLWNTPTLPKTGY